MIERTYEVIASRRGLRRPQAGIDSHRVFGNAGLLAEDRAAKSWPYAGVTDVIAIGHRRSQRLVVEDVAQAPLHVEIVHSLGRTRRSLLIRTSWPWAVRGGVTCDPRNPLALMTASSAWSWHTKR